MIGQTVSHYKILEHLGGGGMGVVYRAEDTRLKRIVALKFLPPELTRDSEAKERFIHEAQAASALQLNNICVVHDIDETADGQMFIVMEYLDGETLKKKIERGPLKIDQAIDIATQVAQGLTRAHKHGIVHRDIKPANIMVTNEGMTEELTSRLSSLSSLRVISRTSAAEYVETDKPMEQIGRELGVDYALEGAVRWAPSHGGGSRVRINSSLTRISDKTTLWAETYDRVIDDIFALQSEISQKVVEKMGVTLLEPERKTVAPARLAVTGNPLVLEAREEGEQKRGSFRFSLIFSIPNPTLRPS
jgi:serine/threonine protein kinase